MGRAGGEGGKRREGDALGSCGAEGEAKEAEGRRQGRKGKETKRLQVLDLLSIFFYCVYLLHAHFGIVIVKFRDTFEPRKRVT